MKVVIPTDLLAAIDKYLTTDWARIDPSKIGALNQVAYIGERIVTIVEEASKRNADICASCGRKRDNHKVRHIFVEGTVAPVPRCAVIVDNYTDETCGLPLPCRRHP